MDFNEEVKRKYKNSLNSKNFRLCMTAEEYRRLLAVSKVRKMSPTKYLRWLITSAYEYLIETGYSL